MPLSGIILYGLLLLHGSSFKRQVIHVTASAGRLQLDNVIECVIQSSTRGSGDSIGSAVLVVHT